MSFEVMLFRADKAASNAGLAAAKSFSASSLTAAISYTKAPASNVSIRRVPARDRVDPLLHGLAASQTDDVLDKSLTISLPTHSYLD